MRSTRGGWAAPIGGKAVGVACLSLLSMRLALREAYAGPAGPAGSKVAASKEPESNEVESKEVESLMAQGNELRRQGQASKALPFFQKAYQLAHTPRTEGQLGLAEMAVGDSLAAEGYLSAALESPENPWIVRSRPALEQTLKRARSQNGEVAIDGGPEGAAVVVNGRRAGTLPLAAAVRVTAGKVDVEISAQGYASSARSVHVGGGGHERMTVNLDKARGPGISDGAGGGGSNRVVGLAPPAPANAPLLASVAARPLLATATDVQPAASGLRTAAWVVGGGAALGLGVGLSLNLAAWEKRNDFNASCEFDTTSNQNVPRPNSTLKGNQCNDLDDTANTEKRWSIVGYVAGAAMAVTSGVLFWSSRPAQPSADLHARMTCAPALGSIFCQGQF